jgi:putative ABC transport system ATP-binding protein
MPLMFDGAPKGRREKLAKALLTQIGLGKRLRNKPTEMSGGQQQRVSIARALINNPKIIYADEPTGNLDTKNTKEIMDILIKRVRENGVTLVMVTHNPELAAYADRVIYMRDGQIQKILDQRTGETQEFAGNSESDNDGAGDSASDNSNSNNNDNANANSNDNNNYNDNNNGGDKSGNDSGGDAVKREG